MHRVASLSIVALLGLVGPSYAVNPVVVQGQNFVDSVTGGRFDIIGVDYQPGGEAGYKPQSGIDPLSNGTVCLRDAALMQILGVNTLRTYNVDPDLNHDECASIFNAVGIYMLVDVNSPLYGGNIDRSNPAGTYTTSYLNRTFAVVDAFRQYNNTLGFISANELVNDNGMGNALYDPPYIRAVTRDLKQYIAARGGRSIPVGYGATDNDKIIVDMVNYIQCNITNGPDSRSDFFGLNDYQWCGDSATFQNSGYDLLTQQFANITIPPFFSEYGCNQALTNGARDFSEVPTIYGPQMTVFSGGLVYEWTQETDDFGLVNINDNGSVTLLQDFNNLRQRYNSLNLTLIESRNNSAVSLKAPVCSSGIIPHPDLFNNSFALPAQPAGTSDLIKNGVKGNIGKFVSVTQTKVPMAVYNTTGQQLTNLSIRVSGNANQPGSSGGSDNISPTGSSPSPSSTKKSAAIALQAAPATGVMALVAAMMFLLA